VRLQGGASTAAVWQAHTGCQVEKACHRGVLGSALLHEEETCDDPPLKAALYRRDFALSTPVSLGCGTLIMIAIIVAMFSGNAGSGVQQLRNDIQALERKIGDLQLKLRNDQRVAP
jgi:hypothetical protein